MSRSKKASWRKLADKRRWTEADAREVVRVWRASGLSPEAFAREHGVSAWRVRWWAPRLEDVAPADSDASAEPAMTFVPAIATTTSGAAIVVRLPDGIEVEFRDIAQVEPEEVGRLVARAARGPVVIFLPRSLNVFVATQPVNLRKSFDGLSNEAPEVLRKDPAGCDDEPVPPTPLERVRALLAEVETDVSGEVVALVADLVANNAALQRQLSEVGGKRYRSSEVVSSAQLRLLLKGLVEPEKVEGPAAQAVESRVVS